MSNKLCSPSVNGYMRTLFPYRYICKGTWHGPDDTVNQINHVMIDQRYRSSDVRSYRVANADLYNCLVIAKLRCCRAQKNNHNMRKA